MVTLVRHDLEFILAQIKIAEAHAAGTPLTTLVYDPHLPWGLRTVDGTYNNLVPGREEFGSADRPMPQLLDQEFPNAETNPRTGQPTSYASTSGSVYDSQPRIISNLIADQTVANPAAVIAALEAAGVTGNDGYAALNQINVLYDAVQAALTGGNEAAIASARDALAAKLDTLGVTLETGPGENEPIEKQSLVIPNVAPDEGLSAPFNGWFTLFGQFFDHGLDLVNKGGNGTVFIPILPDDPLYDPDSQANFMVLTRATNQPGADGILGTPDDVREHSNKTTSWIDQNQTYTSHASHQVFLREYHMVGDKPLATGHLLDGANGGLATWADVKAQARNLLGIELVDTDVLNVPLLATDAYGEFIRGPNGFPQIVFPGNVLVEGNPASPISTAGAIRTGHAFLDDIAHNAVPGTTFDHDGNPATPNIVVQPDTDTITGNTDIGVDSRLNKTAYDNELLDRHFITGDGRGNENIGLSAVHHVFHSEHNRVVDMVKSIALSQDVAFLNEWLLDDVAQVPTDPAAIAALNWDGERLFQAARFTTEMQYQHLAFEEFARRVQPAIDLFVFNSTTDIDPAIVAEFAHVVYRFGHSMLNETVARMSPTGDSADIGLIDAFLNPVAFAPNGMTDDQGAGAIIRGMTNQRGNEIDEFVTGALRNNLVGLPLDLAALNLARGRETGVPSLNAAREQFYENTGSSWVKPYESWVEFAQAMRNPASVINFIAAYGKHATLTAADTLEEKRDAAAALVLGTAGAPADRLDFLNSRGGYTAETTGLNDVEFWIGGLAEKNMPFGGMLGSTFNYVFEIQMENLQNSDRFYYLTRTQGLNLLNELENNSFASIIKKNTDIGLGGAHIGGDIFATYDYILEVNQAVQQDYDPTNPWSKDPGHGDLLLDALQPKVTRADPDGVADTVNYLKFRGGEHVVLGGTNQTDTLIGDDGDDTLWGDGGDDILEGGAGVNRLHGGDGDDIITDGGDISFLHGENGNDVLAAGGGAGELIFGGAGKDVIIVGEDGKEAFGGLGDDFILGGAGSDFLLGNEGDDWMEAGDGFDTTAGDNSELFFNSTIIGHDVMFAGENEHDFDAESGDDIMVQGESVMRNEGMLGFDWVTHKGSRLAADIDLGRPIFTTDAEDILRNRYDKVEGASGYNLNDVIIGDDREGNLLEGATPGLNEATFAGDELNAAGLARITNFAAVTGITLNGNQTWSEGNILLGGGGSDTFQGKGGNDIIDGDNWLNVRISVRDANGVELGTVDGLAVPFETGKAPQAWVGRTIQDLVLNGTINPSQLNIVREILDGDADNTGIDTAVYQDSFANYTITRNAQTGEVFVEHTGFGTDPEIRVSDGRDRLTNIERLQFADRTFSVSNVAATGTVTISDTSPTETRTISASLTGVSDENGLPTALVPTFTWQRQTVGGDWVSVATGANYTPVQADVGRPLRAVASFTDALGYVETVASAPTTIVGDLINGGPAGQTHNGTAGDDIINGNGGPDVIEGLGGNDEINGGTGNDVIFGGAGDDVITGGAGVDAIAGNAGDDTVIWGWDGLNRDRDIVNGGTEVTVGDTFVVNGSAILQETFQIYTRAAAQAAFGYAGTAEIVIRHSGGFFVPNQIIAELTEIEEIVINSREVAANGAVNAGPAGGDTVQVFGDFTLTSLDLSTITINGTTGNDTIDISALQSAHRIVFKSNGGQDTIVGTLRPQDVIQLAPGALLSDYQETTNGGMKTLSNGTHSVTFAASGTPSFQEVPAAGGGSPAGSPFALTASDIAGLTALVKGEAYGESVTGVRDLSGVGNNLDNPNWGKADTPFIRLTEARYGAEDPATGNKAVNPIFEGLDARTLSNILGTQELDLAKQAGGANIFFMAFGQYFDHGLDFVAKGGNGTITIGGADGGPPNPQNPADLTRATVVGRDADGNPQHTNKTSTFVDQNQAYGSNELVGIFLREAAGNGEVGPRLFFGGPDPANPAFDLLPTLRQLIHEHWDNDTAFKYGSFETTFRTYFAGLVNDQGVINQAMIPGMVSNFMGTGQPLLLDTNPFINLLDHVVAGDGRANENVTLTAMHTIWARNHNWHVANLEAAGFVGTAEELFEAAKMINEAEYQRVVFDEFADALLGGMRGGGTHGHDDYNPDADPGISHEFAAAVYRVGHSLISDTITVLDANGQPKQVTLFDAFLNPSNDPSVFTMPLDQLAQRGYVPKEGYAQLGTNNIVGGIITQPAEEVDFNIVDAVRNDLVRIRADLFAFNVARGRDVGLGTLNQVRADLAASQNPYVRDAVGFAGDLSPYASWDDFQVRNGLSNAVMAQLKQAYPDLVLDTPEKIAAFQAANPDIQLVNGNTVKGIDRVDLWVGGLAEKHINGGMVGQTFWVVLHEQFDRLQEADRFYYTDRFDNFDFYQTFVDGQNFADIIARNTGLTNLPEDVFAVSDEDDGVGNGDDDGQGDDDTAGGGDGTGGDDDDAGGDGDDDTTGGGDDDDDTTTNPNPNPNPGAGAVAGLVLLGTTGTDLLQGAALDDSLVGLGGDDVLFGKDGADSVAAGDGNDYVNGGAGRDVIFAGAGDDHAFAGAGDDMVYGEAGVDRLFGEAGDDLMNGGAGADTLFGGAGNDRFLAEAGDGDDSYFGEEGADTLDFSAITANLTVDLGQGSFGVGHAQSAQSGFDAVSGVENVVGGAGNDTLIASDAANVLSGGAGNDTFVFKSVAAADGDTISGFQPGDRLDLSAIDADTGTAGDQGFTILNGGSLTAPGQLLVTFETGQTGDFTLLRGSVDGDPASEFSLRIEGHVVINNGNVTL